MAHCLLGLKLLEIFRQGAHLCWEPLYLQTLGRRYLLPPHLAPLWPQGVSLREGEKEKVET